MGKLKPRRCLPFSGHLSEGRGGLIAVTEEFNFYIPLTKKAPRERQHLFFDLPWVYFPLLTLELQDSQDSID